MAQQPMRARAYCAHTNICDHWALRCVTRCPDQVASLKQDPQCLSPQASIYGTHLSTHCSRDKDCPNVLSEEFVALNDDNVCTASIMVDKGILEFLRSLTCIIDADSDDENEMNNAAPVPPSSEIKNVIKTRQFFKRTFQR
ncbi:hypothetical protein TNCV_4795211 [Trichonephila clavipes]|nr:hypothetical protein TNCV_4795211 [Trichonephila clavipes]